MRFTIIATAAMAIFCISPALSWAADVQNTAASDPDRIVCRAESAPTGTRIGARRICAAQREWDRKQKSDQKLLEERQLRGLQSGDTHSGGG